MQNLPLGIRPIGAPEDTGSKTVAVGAGAFTKQQICKIQLKNARRFFWTFVGNALDAALIGHITFRVLVDGAVMFTAFFDTLGQWAPPEAIQNEIMPYLELPQNALLEIQCDGDAGNPGGNITGRLRGLYGMVETQL